MPIEVRTLAEWEAAGVPGMLSVVIPAHNEGWPYRRHRAGVLAEILWSLLLRGPGKFWRRLDEEPESYWVSADGNGRDHFIARGIDHRHGIRSGICDIDFATIWVH